MSISSADPASADGPFEALSNDLLHSRSMHLAQNLQGWERRGRDPDAAHSTPFCHTTSQPGRYAEGNVR